MNGRGAVIAVLGAESTGKTTLCGALGAAFAAEGRDVVGAALFAYKGLWLTTLLYAVFVAMAAVGWRSWARRATSPEATR